MEYMVRIPPTLLPDHTGVMVRPGRPVHVQANKSTDFDFDAALANVAEKVWF